MRAIAQLFSDTVALVTEIKTYGRSPRSYANVSDSDTPRLWLHRITPIDNTSTSGGFERPTFTVNFDLSTYCDFDATEETIDACFDTLNPIFYKFIRRLLRDERVYSLIKEIRREELYHDLDANLVGWMVTMNIQLVEDITYEC
jgi:hypothetical protein